MLNKQINFGLYEIAPQIAFGALLFILLAGTWEVLKIIRKRKLVELKCSRPEHAKGVIWGLKGKKKVVFSPIGSFHSGVFSSTGEGKTSSLNIPTIRSWCCETKKPARTEKKLPKGTCYTIDVAMDILKACESVPDKLVYCPENPDIPDGAPYNIFGPIDDAEDKNEALAQLAYLLMPEKTNINENARFFLVNGRKILTAALIAFYGEGMDFIEICEKIVGSEWKELFKAIFETGNEDAKLYLKSFIGASEINTGSCKQSCDESITLYATNAKIKKSIHRPKAGEKAVEPKRLEDSNIFFCVSEDKLSLYGDGGLMTILTSQIMQYVCTRTPTEQSPNILISLDEFGALGIDSKLVIDMVSRGRKRKISALLLMQSPLNIQALYGEDISKIILSNLKYKVLLCGNGNGLGDVSAQKYFADLLGYKKVKKRSISKNMRQQTTTESMEKEYIIEPADLDRQGKDTVILIAPNEPNGYLKLKKNYYFKK